MSRRTTWRRLTATAAAATAVTVVAALSVPLGSAAAQAPPPTPGTARGIPLDHPAAGLARHSSAPDVPVHAALPKGLPGKGTVVVQLDLAAPTAQAAFGGLHTTSTRERADAATRARAAERVAQAALIARLAQPATQAQVLYTTTVLTDAVAVRADVGKLAAISALPGVTGVHQVAPKFRANTRAVPLTGSPRVWGAYGAGAGVNVAVIDTGVDYTHADFGGAGTTAAYDDAFAHDTVTASGGKTYFPTPVVTQGNDLVGDAYTAGYNDDGTADTTPGAQTPVPDPNPLDCSTVTGSVGHGTHVSGIVAGRGVKTDGSTYTGAYDAGTETGTAFKVGPGTAPRANLGSWRVFGCHGATFVVSQALDQIAQTRVDADPSNDVNIMNLSLGADFTRDDDPDSVNINRLAMLGVLPVVAAGNSGDVYETGGSPGSATRALTVAATDDGGANTDALKVDSPARLAGNYPGAFGALYVFDATHPGVTGAALARPTDPVDQESCKPYTAAGVSQVTGKVAVIDAKGYAAGGSCGSATKGTNATNAGAIGVVIVSADESLNSINGAAAAPTITVQQSVGQLLIAALPAGPVTVDMTAAQKNASSLDQPGNVDKIADFTSRGGVQPGNLKPDVGAPGVSIFSAASGTGSAGVSYDGTSMATPHTAGIAAEVLAAHRGYSAEQLKAAVMNTADNDLFVNGAAAGGQTYGPARVGAGRVRADLAVPNGVLAYADAGSGAVSANFGLIALTGPTATATRTVTVQNTGTAAETYTPSLRVATPQAGVDVTVSPTSVPVAAGQTATVTLTLTATRSALTKTEDPTRDDNVAGFTQDFVAEATGLLLLTPADTGQPTLRVPFGAAVRPAAAMHSVGGLTFAPGATTSSVALDGTGVANGVPGRASSVSSAVSAYTLQATSPQLPACATHPITQDQGPGGCIFFGSERAADLAAVGVTSTVPSGGIADGIVQFGLATYAPWVTPSWNYARGTVGDIRFRILVDTTGDGKPDRLVDIERIQDSTDLLGTLTYDLAKVGVTDRTTGVFTPVPYGDPTFDDALKASAAADDSSLLDAQFLNGVDGATDTDVFNSDVLGAPVSAAALGLTAGHTAFSYTVVSQSLDNAPVQLDSVGPLTADAAHPALSVPTGTGVTGPTTLFRDQPGTSLAVSLDRAAPGPDLGLLLLHHHNVDGQRAEVVPVTVQSPPAPPPGPTTGPTTGPTKAPASCPVPTSTTRVYGARTVRYGPVRNPFTVKLFVNPAGCTGPGGTATAGGKVVGLYVDGVKRAQLRTGAGGTIAYGLTFRKGRHRVEAVFYGSPGSLAKSISPAVTVSAPRP